MTEYVKSNFHPDHDITVTEHGMGLDLNQEGRLIHIDESQFERLIEIFCQQAEGVSCKN